MTNLFQKNKLREGPELLTLDIEELDEVTGGLEEDLEPDYPKVNAKDASCARFFLARGKRNSNACEGCFYYHPLEESKGYCSR